MSDKSDKTISLKCVFVGDSNVGKTSIASYLVYKKFSLIPESTIGASFTTYTVDKKARDLWDMSNRDKLLRLRFELWDTAGQERYRSIVPMYLRGVQIVFLVFDRGSHQSYENLTKYWVPYVESNLHNQSEASSTQSYVVSVIKTQIIVIENKVDLPDKLGLTKNAAEYCQLKGFDFWQTSAKNGSGINELFEYLSTKIITMSQKYDLHYTDNLYGAAKDLSSRPTLFSHSESNKKSDLLTGDLDYEDKPSRNRCRC